MISGRNGALIGAVVAVALVAVPSVGERLPSVAPQTIPLLPRQDSIEWSKWLIGEWEGWLEDAEGKRMRHVQTFECEVECRYLLTRIRQEVAPGQWYHGTGMFRYDEAGQSFGEWFGIVGDRNIGLGRRSGEAWVWEIHRAGGSRVHRVRERIGADEYRVTSRSVGADGRERVTGEIMKRVLSSGGGAWTMPAAYRAVQLASLASQRAFLHAMADSMPERFYGDADHAGQRTFAEHVYHAAVANAQAVDRLFEGPSFEPPDPARATASRAALRA